MHFPVGQTEQKALTCFIDHLPYFFSNEVVQKLSILSYRENFYMLVFYNRSRKTFHVVFRVKTNFHGIQTHLLNGMKYHLFWFPLWNNQICKYLSVVITPSGADKSGQ